MSTERPKRTIIRKKYDDSDGMPWCEERVVRKVLFLSLREFREAQRNQLPGSMQNTHTPPRDLRSRTPAPRALRSHTPAPRDLRSLTPAVFLNGVVANANGQRSTRLSVNGRSGRHASRGCNGNNSRNPADRTTKRPRLQAQRKFAQSPPSSPGHTPQQTANHALSLTTTPTIIAVDHHSQRPGTEDFLSFLCLRGSVALPSNMTFLGRYQNEELEDDPVVSQNSHRHLSTNQRGQPGGKDQNRRTALRSSTEAPLTSCSASPMGESKEKGKLEAEQENRMSSAPLLRPRRPNQVSIVTGLSGRITPSSKQNLSQASPISGSSKIAKMAKNTKTSSSCASRASKSRHRPGNRRPHPGNRRHRPGNPHRRPGNSHHSLSPLLKKASRLFHVDISSGTSCSKTLSLTPLSSRTTNRQLKGHLQGQPGVLRESRRRMGLPPETSSASLVNTPLTRSSKLRCHIGEVRLNRAGHHVIDKEHESKRNFNKLKHNKAGCHVVKEEKNDLSCYVVEVRNDEADSHVDEEKPFEAGHPLGEEIQEEAGTHVCEEKQDKARHSVGEEGHMEVGSHVGEVRQEEERDYVSEEKQEKSSHNVGDEGCMEVGSHAGKEKQDNLGLHFGKERRAGRHVEAGSHVVEEKQSKVSHNVGNTRHADEGHSVSEAKQDGVGQLVGEERQNKADHHVGEVSFKLPREQRPRRGQEDTQVKPAVTRLRAAYTPVTRSTITSTLASIPANTPASRSPAPVIKPANNSSRNISKNTSRSKCTTSATKTRTSPRTSRA